MKSVVRLIRWNQPGAILGLLHFDGESPYVPPLKTAVLVQNECYVVVTIESRLEVSERGEASWVVTVELARS